MIAAMSGVTDITAISYNSTSPFNGASVEMNESYEDVIHRKSIIQVREGTEVVFLDYTGEGLNVSIIITKS